MAREVNRFISNLSECIYACWNTTCAPQTTCIWIFNSKSVLPVFQYWKQLKKAFGPFRKKTVSWRPVVTTGSRVSNDRGSNAARINYKLHHRSLLMYLSSIYWIYWIFIEFLLNFYWIFLWIFWAGVAAQNGGFREVNLPEFTICINTNCSRDK